MTQRVNLQPAFYKKILVRKYLQVSSLISPAVELVILLTSQCLPDLIWPKGLGQTFLSTRVFSATTTLFDMR